MVLFQSSMGTLLLINTGIVDGAALLVARVGLFWGEGGGGEWYRHRCPPASGASVVVVLVVLLVLGLALALVLAVFFYLSWGSSRGGLNPFSTAVLFWGQSTWD